MQQLATIIQEQLDTLVDQYDARLRSVPGYSSLPEAVRRDLERRFLNLIIQSLEAADYSPLVQYAQERATQWAAQGLNLIWFQQALSVPEELLVPLVQSVETSNFVYQALNRSQAVVWQMIAERARQTEERFRSIVETAHSGIMIIDDEYHFVYANDQLTRISGYSQTELIGADFRQLLDDGSRQLVADRYAHRQQGEEVPADYEVAFIRKDGQKRALEMSAVLLRDTSGHTQTVAQVLDVTDRKQAEAALARERNLLHTLIDSLPDQIFFKDTEGRVILNNMADARAMRVASPAEAIGKSVFDVFPVELAELYHADDMTVVHSGQAINNRVEPGIDEAGQVRWIQTTKVPLTDEQGKPIGLVGFAHDITQLKISELRVQELLKMREHQARTSTEVSQEIAAAPELRELFQRVVTLIKERFNYYHAQIFRYDPALDAIVLVTGYGEVGQHMLADEHRLPMGRGVVGTAAANGQTILATDVAQDQDWRPNPYLPDTRGELAVPIKLRDEVLGILDVQSDRAGALSTDDRLLLEGLCGQIAVAIESTRLVEVLRRSESELSQALQIAKLAYWEYDVEKDLFLFNDQFYSIFHTTAEQAGGYHLSSAQYAGKFVYPDDLPVVGAEIERALNSTGRHFSRDLVHRIQYADGGVGYMSVSINIDRDEQGHILRYYGANQDITERQLAEVELEKFKLGLERSNSAIFITDPQGVITYVNPAFEKIYGYTPEETLGQTPRILKSGVIPQEQYKNFWDTLLHGQIVAGEIVNKAKDGRLISIEGSNNPIQDENGQMVGFLGMHTDITQRKQAEQILRQSEAQLSQALQISKLAYWEYDVEKDLFQFNDQFYSIFHTTAEQEGGYQLSSAQYAQKFVYPEDLPVVGSEIERALNSTDRHYSRQIDHRIQYADGGVGYIAVSINIDRDEQGKILRYYGANQDISGRKQVEEALAQEQYLTHALMESVADHIYFKDVQSRFLRISKSLADRFGLSDPAQAIGKTDFDFFTEEHARPAFEDEQQIIRTGQPITQEERETWLDQPDTWVLTTKLPLRDEFGNIVGTFGISHDTTERKQAEALLAQERNLLRILIDSLPLYVYIKDRTSKFVINNKLHLGVMGAATQEEVIGKGDFDFFPAEDADQYFADEQALMQSDQPLLNREETVIDQTTGQRQWVSSTKVPYHDGRGNVIGLVGVTEDITERKRAEEEMQRTQRFLDSVVENIPLMLFVKDATDLRFVRWNKAGEDLMGIARVEMLGKNDLDLVPPEEAELFMANDQQVLINKEPLDIPEEPLETRFKGIRTLHTRKIPILDEQGNPQYLLGISEDITERKQAEAMLAQERNLLQTVIDTLPDSIYAKDTESRFTLANLTEIQLNGATTFEDLRGKNDFDRYPRELAEQYFAAEQPVLRDGVALINHEERGLDRMGNPRWHLSTKVPLLDSQGHIVGLVGMTRDITESKQAEVEREQLLLEQQQRALQLQTASEISRAASSILKLDELLPQAVELIRARFGFYYVGIFLADDTGRWAVLRAGTGEAGQTMLTNAHQLEIGGASMIGQCIANRQARVALDVGQEAIRSDNPLLPLTHSEMALPLTSRGSIIGAMTIQSDQAAAFTSDDVTVLQSMADQISNAVENARLYEQANTALQEVDAINRRLTGEAWDTYLHHQAGQEVISLTDDSQTAPEQLSQVDDLLAAGEITIEPTEDDPSEATVSAPILLRGQPIGALRMRTPLDSWDKDAEAILTGIAGHVAQAVENARLIEQTQRTASRERAINEINARVRQTIDLDAILRTAVNELGQSLKAARVTARIDVSDDTQTSRRRKTDTGPLPAAADRPRGNDHD